MTVELESLDGTLRFDRLKSWAARPAAPGAGDDWRDGNLEYAIAVRGNTFVQTGGDEGVVRGVFLGLGHGGSGMGGTLKRDDLTAAFGGALRSE